MVWETPRPLGYHRALDLHSQFQDSLVYLLNTKISFVYKLRHLKIWSADTQTNLENESLL